MSITEIRSDKTGKAETWTPRDALVSVLRKIDSGEIAPENLFLAYNYTKNDKLLRKCHCAGPAKTLEFIGMLSLELHLMKVES